MAAPMEVSDDFPDLIDRFEPKRWVYRDYVGTVVGIVANQVAGGTVDVVTAPEDPTWLRAVGTGPQVYHDLSHPRPSRVQQVTGASYQTAEYEHVVTDALFATWDEEGRLSYFAWSVVAVASDVPEGDIVLMSDPTRTQVMVVPKSMSPLAEGS